MLNIKEIEQSIDKNFAITINEIKDSMAANDQIASGRARDSLRKDIIVESGAITGTIYGADYIDTLETGISPQRSNMESWTQTWHGLYNWIDRRASVSDIQFKSKFATIATAKQKEFGSELYRRLSGGRRGNVYSDKVEPLAERIKGDIGNIIVSTKILE